MKLRAIRADDKVRIYVVKMKNKPVVLCLSTRQHLGESSDTGPWLCVTSALCLSADSRGGGGKPECERSAGSVSRQRDEISGSHRRTTKRTTRPGNDNSRQMGAFFIIHCKNKVEAWPSGDFRGETLKMCIWLHICNNLCNVVFDSCSGWSCISTSRSPPLCCFCLEPCTSQIPCLLQTSWKPRCKHFLKWWYVNSTELGYKVAGSTLKLDTLPRSILEYRRISYPLLAFPDQRGPVNGGGVGALQSG